MHFESDGVRLFADRWPGTGPPLVLLHAGVADRRSWYAVAERLRGVGPAVAYDRRGFGDSPPSDVPFRHLDDLLAVLDALGGEAAWLVGSSMGGQLALDAAVAYPERVAGLVLLAPAVSGAPDSDRFDPATERLAELIDAAAGDVDEVNRLETWLWLDGPASAEQRVTGAARQLALDMNAVVLHNDVPEAAGASDVDAWQSLEQVTAPTLVAWGDLDLPFIVETCVQLAGRLPRARQRILAGTAHLPYLEQPELIAEIIGGAVTA